MIEELDNCLEDRDDEILAMEDILEGLIGNGGENLTEI